MSISLKVYDNGDHTCLVWFPDDGAAIPECRGYAIRRTLTKGGTKTTEYLHNFTGFKEGDAAPAAEEAWKWPVQRYLWWDYQVEIDDEVEYAVVPVLGSYSPDEMKLAEELASEASAALKVSGQDSRSISAYFNKGIVASQWVARELEREGANQKKAKTTLKEIVGKPGDPLRDGLSGLLRTQILSLLEEAKSEGGKVFAALYELNDPELLDGLRALGKNANLILGNGAFKPPEKDENAAIRNQLRQEGGINVFDRIVSSGHFAHNKFVVFCDAEARARRVLTGSTNWTVSGLCTQANNGIIVEDEAVADAYLQQWERLRQAGNDFPASLVKSNSAQKTFQVDDARLSVWFTPTDEMEDLQQARRLINAAEEGILFLFFNPGPFQDDPHRWTLLQSILNRHHAESNPYYDQNLYIRGVVNQEIPRLTEDPKAPQKPGARPAANELDPAAPVHPVALFTGGNQAPERLSQDVLVPASIKKNFGWWEEEPLGASMVNVHSKVVVLDPFGENPVVMTGSHNLGPKASRMNDDNMVIVEGDAALARAYALNIISIFQQYRWRRYATEHTGDPSAWHGLQDNDTWQTGYLNADKAEMKFWLGEGTGAAPTPVAPPAVDGGARPAPQAGGTARPGGAATKKRPAKKTTRKASKKPAKRPAKKSSKKSARKTTKKSAKKAAKRDRG